MGDTVIKDADKLSPYEVGGLTTFLGSKGLDNHVKIKGKSVGKRMDHRKYYELAKKNESSNINKTSDMVKQTTKQSSLVNNNEKIMNKQVKEAFVKLATIKLAINYVLRNRLMSKQAAMPRGSGLPTDHLAPSIGYTGTSDGTKVPLQRNVSPVINSQSQEPNLFAEAKRYQSMPSSPSVPADELQPLRSYVPRSFKELRKAVGPAVRQANGEKAWNSKTNTYDFNGDWNAYQQERDRIESGFSQMTPEEQAIYENNYKRHIAALNRWRDFQNTQNPATPTKGQLDREQYSGQQAYQGQPTKPKKPSFGNRVDNTYAGAGNEMSGAASNGYAKNLDGSGWPPASGSAPFVPQDMPTLEPIQRVPVPATPSATPTQQATQPQQYDPRIYNNAVYNAAFGVSPIGKLKPYVNFIRSGLRNGLGMLGNMFFQPDEEEKPKGMHAILDNSGVQAPVVAQEPYPGYNDQPY